MTLFDHLFVILTAVVVPVIGYISFRRLQARVAAGGDVNRGHMYLNTTLTQWLLFAMAMIGWALLERPWSDLGFSLSLDPGFLIGGVLALIAMVVLVLQIRQVKGLDAAGLRKLHSAYEPVMLILPRNGNELARFYGLSVTAGIVEEILWRGFMFWYLGQFMPLAAVAVVSTLLFALAHLYQGWAQLPGVALVAAGMAGLYILTGSVWLPIVLHIAVDILQGRMAYEVLQRSQFDDSDLDSSGAVPAA